MPIRPPHERWHARPPRASVPPALIPWLTDPASLTARIRARCGHFTVRVVRQSLGRPHRDEAALLGLRAGQTAWLREVVLLADGRPVVFARSVLPRDNVRGGWSLFRDIGTRPLGATLFADPRIVRGALSCIALDRRDTRYHRALAAAGRAGMPRRLWARRSVFFRDRRALLVSEIFLPAIADLPR